jgi:hypothetical protein
MSGSPSYRAAIHRRRYSVWMRLGGKRSFRTRPSPVTVTMLKGAISIRQNAAAGASRT